MNKLIIFVALFCASIGPNLAQTSEYKLACVGFYNLENLFDTVNDSLINDEEFLPEGTSSWTEERYQEKLANMAFVISKIGTELTPLGPSVLGISEIENRKVIEDLVSHPLISDRNYQIVHYNSPDKRGIDVGLIYNPAHFKVIDSEALAFPHKEGDTLFTRDVLYVNGLLENEEIHIMVNHWPSRRGGEAKSAPRRNQAAKICQDKIDDILLSKPDAKILVMGDLNDNPNNESVRSVIRAKANKDELNPGDTYNPMYNMFKKGLGSNAYRDAWSLFDQIIMTEALVNKDQTGYFLYKTEIYNPKFMVRRKGQYKGYPKRTFAGGTYLGGYSDHFPVFVYLAKKIS